MMFNTNVRPENEIFSDLEELCTRPGFIHVIAHFCFRDNLVRYSEEITTEDMQNLYSMDGLIRNEISTLIGLMIKEQIDYTLPPPDTFQEMINQAETLLHEMHCSLASHFNIAQAIEEKTDPFSNAMAYREPIFYGGESAYTFQYRDLAPIRYKNDSKWLKINKGFSIEEAQSVVKHIGILLNEEMELTLVSLADEDPANWTLLPAFEFVAHDVQKATQLDIKTVNNVLAALSLPQEEDNAGFSSLSDFNVINAYPIIPNGETFIAFQAYGLSESIYDSPFYWFNADKDYATTAMINRGAFTESFAKERLARVFGDNHVFSNVDIFDKRGEKAGEIDVLVLFADRVIILQAKSKKLTIPARKGNDKFLKDDFQKAVQDAYHQGLKCAKLIDHTDFILRDANGTEIKTNTQVSQKFIFCVVSDHYPALNLQTRHFLSIDKSGETRPPFVMDVFLLDAMTEMLDTPLRFLDYVIKRTQYNEKILATNELTILSYHLSHNLYMNGEHDLIHFGEDIAVGLDIAMTARREGIPGAKTPDGILTRLIGTKIGDLIDSILRAEDKFYINFGLLLLNLGESTLKTVSNGIEKITQQTLRDKQNHDLSVEFNGGKTGLTIHSNFYDHQKAIEELAVHCKWKKYVQKADEWFGVSLNPMTLEIKCGLQGNAPWKYDAQIEKALSDAKAVTKKASKNRTPKEHKIGRNAPCPCGSGKKYKKCCLNKPR